jgi:hypothetical protein
LRAYFERFVEMFFSHPRNITSTRNCRSRDVLHHVGGARISVTIVYTSFSGDKRILKEMFWYLTSLYKTS